MYDILGCPWRAAVFYLPYVDPRSDLIDDDVRSGLPYLLALVAAIDRSIIDPTNPIGNGHMETCRLEGVGDLPRPCFKRFRPPSQPSLAPSAA